MFISSRAYLIHGTTNKLGSKVTASHHVGKRVFIAFGPKLINELDIVLNVESPIIFCSHISKIANRR